MTGTFDPLLGRTPRQRRWALGIALAVILMVPLAVAGLVAGALATADQRIDAIPAIIVNNDTMVTTKQADGTEQQVLAGRQLVTELTSPDAPGFAWSISNSEDAAEALAEGRAYAVLTVPEDFSASITSLAGPEPTKANLSLRTDDAHAFLAGSAAQAVGTAMAGAFGREITTRYLTSFYEELGLVGASLTTAAAGAAELSTGVGSLASGLDAVATGASSTASGASELLTGVARYTDGVESLGAGLTRLSSGASQLAPLRTGLPRYASGVQGAADGFRSVNQALQANPTNADLVPSLNEFQAGLDQLADQGSGLAPAASGIGRVVEGVAAAAEGAGRLSAQAGGITSGAQGLATGTAAVSSGVASSAAGADQLVGGATELASGLEAGATQASAFGDRDAAATAGVVAEPVGITPTRNHALDSISPVIGMVFVPVGLWIGALAMFLLIRPVSRMALNSTASNGRLVLRGLGQGAAVAVVQAVSVVALLHAALGVRWDLLPATLPFSILIALVFMVVHHVLTAAFGRFGIIVSLVLLALQLTSSGGPFPLQMVAEPYQAVSSFLPLTWAVRGMQALVSGAGGPDVWASVTALSLFGLVGLAVSFWLVARLRRVRPPALLPAVG